MSSIDNEAWLYSNRYSADKACEHCEGVIRHQPWCITQSPVILYAFEAVLDANKLAPGDHIQLHALGVRWADNACQCGCRQLGVDAK